jgi:hypothetical protein
LSFEVFGFVASGFDVDPLAQAGKRSLHDLVLSTAAIRAGGGIRADIRSWYCMSAGYVERSKSPRSEFGNGAKSSARCAYSLKSTDDGLRYHQCHSSLDVPQIPVAHLLKK